MIFDKLLDGLASQGAMGIMLGLILLMFVRFFNKTFDAQVERDKSHYAFMQQVLAVMRDIKDECSSCRAEIIASEVAKLGAVEDRILDAVRDIGRFVVDENRRDNDLSRPHTATPPPVQTQPYEAAAAGSRRVP